MLNLASHAEPQLSTDSYSLQSVEYGKKREKSQWWGKEADSGNSNLVTLAKDSRSLRGVKYGEDDEKCRLREEGSMSVVLIE